MFHNIIKRVPITEKSGQLSANENKYVFDVDVKATRTQVADAIATFFNVKVVKVNIVRRPGKLKRSRTQRGRVVRMENIKRAIVSVAEGQKIEII